MTGQLPNGSGSATPPSAASWDLPSAQAVPDDGNELWGHYVGECWHRMPGGPVFHVGPCKDCDVGAVISGWPLVELHPLLVSGGRSVSSRGLEFLDLLSAMARLGAYRSVLAEVVALAQQAPGLADEQLRVRLLGLVRGLGGETR